MASMIPSGVRDWYVTVADDGGYVTVDTLDERPVRATPSSARDIARATLRGRFRSGDPHWR